MFLAIFCLTNFGCGQSDPKLDLKTDYQAIFLNNGQVFFGKVEKAGSAYPLIRDVYYVQPQTDPKTKETKNILIKRGNEWHGPDMMYLNARHIVVIEPVANNSRVSQLIKEAKNHKPGEAQ